MLRALGFLLALFVLVPGNVLAAPFERALTLGDEGTDVAALQTFLKDAGFYAYPEITGYFGPITSAALARYQASVGLEAVGSVGPLTRARLNAVAPGTEPVTLTSIIRQLQKLLQDAGYKEVELTGTLDTSTLTALDKAADGDRASDGPTRHSGGGSSNNDEEDPDTTGPVLSAISSGTPSNTSTTITWSTDEAADSQLAYGTTAAYGATTTLDTALVTNHSVPLTGLSPSTTYHYRVRSADATGNATFSGDQTFTTSATPDATPPVLSSIASSTGVTTAVITWTTNEAATSTVLYGLNSSYGSASTSAAFVTSHSVSLSGLTAATTYHFQIGSQDAAGNVATSTDLTFTTTAAPDTTPPVLSSIVATPSETGAVITWTTNEAATSTVLYGLNSSYGTASTSATLVTSHSITLAGLTAATTYHYRVGSQDAAGNVATSTDLTFTTDSGVAEDGEITSATIQSNGYLADIVIEGLTANGTYALTPTTTPKLVFTVTSEGYDASGDPTTIEREVYGTVPHRYAYPNGTDTVEVASGGELTATVALSDEILPDDEVTLTGLSGWYTDGTPVEAISNLAVTNDSAVSEYRPIGAWITPTRLRRAPNDPFTVEFTVASRFARDNGQVAAVEFIATDGSATVTKTVSTMTQSTYLKQTTCTATSGSAVLSSCGSTDGMIPRQFVTVATGSGSGVGAGNPRIASVDSATQVTLDTNATTNGSVTLTLGAPVYVYAATFSSGEMDTLAQGTTTIRAIAYSHVGSVTLDTADGADGVPLAATTINPNLKNLLALNDKNNNYRPIYAWVNPGGAGASPAVQTTASDPGSVAYYATIKNAADALKTYYNANLSHNNACGGVIYLKAGTTTGFGGTIGGATAASPSNCLTYMTISGEPGHGATDVIIDAAGSGNRDAGYTTILKNLKLMDNATNKVVIQGPDGSSTAARQAHLIFQGVWLRETQSSPSAYINQIGWREYYNSIVDQEIGDGNMTRGFSVTGITSSEFGSTLIGPAMIHAYTVVGNIGTGARASHIGNSSVNMIQPTSIFIGFNKLMNVRSTNVINFTGGTEVRDHAAFVQNVFEQAGSDDSPPVFTFGADGDTTAYSNMLRQHNTTVGGRTNVAYNDIGATTVAKTQHDLFNFDDARYSKSDYFNNPNDRYITGITVTNGGTGYTQGATTVTVAAPAGTNGVTALAHVNVSGGVITSITLDPTICGNTGGIGYASVPSVTINGDGSGATATATLSGSNVIQPCAARVGNWRYRYSVGNIGNVSSTNSANSNSPPGYDAWIGVFAGLLGNTTTQNFSQTAFSFLDAAQNSGSGDGDGTGLGWYKLNTTTSLINRVPAGRATFPGDIDGTPRANDGTGCAGAYECD